VATARQRAPDATRPSPAERGYGHQWRKVRAEVLERDHWVCYRCGHTGATTVDHLIPKCTAAPTTRPTSPPPACHATPVEAAGLAGEGAGSDHAPADPRGPTALPPSDCEQVWDFCDHDGVSFRGPPGVGAGLCGVRSAAGGPRQPSPVSVREHSHPQRLCSVTFGSAGEFFLGSVCVEVSRPVGPCRTRPLLTCVVRDALLFVLAGDHPAIFI
jgi:hypothetical protein